MAEVYTDPTVLEGGLKFVRWNFEAKNRAELTVCRGDEVEIIKPAENKFWRVKFKGRIGLIPAKCFVRRTTVSWPYAADDENEVNVSKGEVVGILKEEGNMCKIMKEDNSEGYVPKHCFYSCREVFADYEAISKDQLTVKKGDIVGLVDKTSLDAYWHVFLKGNIGLVPSKCFEPLAQVYWDYEAKKPDDLTVKKGDVVSLTDFDCTDQQQFRVRLEDQIGFVPKECFEIPAKVIKSYKAAKETELTVAEGDEIHVIDATAYIQVRLGQLTGEVPLSCINVDVQKIVPMLESKREEENEIKKEVNGTFEDIQGAPDVKPNDAVLELNLDMDQKSATRPLEQCDKEVIVSYLQGISVEKMVSVGFSLGLTFETLQKMSTEKIHDEVIKAWLLKKDGVTNVGIPTWKSLGVVLQKHGLSTVAKTIQKDNTRLVMDKLKHLRWYDSTRRERKLSIVNEACAKWHDIALQIEMPDGILEDLKDKHDNVTRFTEVLSYWIKTGGNTNYRATWIGLQTILRDIGLSVLAEKIGAAMPYLAF